MYVFGLFHAFFSIELNFLPKTLLISIFLCTFAKAINLGRLDVLIVGWSRWVEHYILEGVTDVLFLDPSKLPQIELVIQDKCMGDCHGV